MIPPCAQKVLQSFGSVAFVMSRQRMPAEARVNAVVSPAIPVPITIAGKCSRFFSLAKANLLYRQVAIDNPAARTYFEVRQSIKMSGTDDSLFKALADPTRRHILKLLKKRSMSAGEIGEAFEITLGSLSHHFNVLKAADLVRSERRGEQIVYSLNTSVFEDVAALLADLFERKRR